MAYHYEQLIRVTVRADGMDTARPLFQNVRDGLRGEDGVVVVEMIGDPEWIGNRVGGASGRRRLMPTIRYLETGCTCTWDEIEGAEGIVRYDPRCPEHSHRSLSIPERPEAQAGLTGEIDSAGLYRPPHGGYPGDPFDKLPALLVLKLGQRPTRRRDFMASGGRY